MTAMSPPPPPPSQASSLSHQSSAIENGNNNNNSNGTNNHNSSFVKVKCPRSKSQPAFKDTTQINAINSAVVPSVPAAQPAAPLGLNNTNGNSSSSNNHGIYSNLNGIYSAHSTASSNINKFLGNLNYDLLIILTKRFLICFYKYFLVYEANRLTSSPICNFNASSMSTSMISATNGEHPSPSSPTQPAIPNKISPNNTNNNNNNSNSNNNNGNNNNNSSSNSNDTSSSSSSNPESSFYEDQLENELESISSPGPTMSSNGTTGYFKNGKSKQQTNGLSSNSSNNINNTVSNGVNGGVSNGVQSNGGGPAAAPLSAIKSSKSKQNHVSFNINNAIYTSRQETPIPISVLKQQQQQSIQQPSAQTQSMSSLSLQSSLKKNNLADDQPVVGKVKNKSVRIDAKTTIL